MSSHFIAKDAQAYDSMMGRWSRELAPLLIGFAGVATGDRVLDLGSGTGSLAFSLPADVALVIGVDYAQMYVDAASARNSSGHISFEQGDGHALRFGDAGFDCALSQLVIQHVPDPVQVLREMRRVTRPGGVVAAAVWDSFGGMGAHRMLWDTASVIDPDAAKRRAKSMTRKAAQPGGLRELFAEAGFTGIVSTELLVRMAFVDFADYWQPMLDGEGSLGNYVTALGDDARERLRLLLLDAYLSGQPDGPRSFVSVAWAVKALVR
jgi:ubiquinone/menaquinone biosynthesis C-methylase UbiE